MEICPRCLSTSKADLVDNSCVNCGFKYGDYVKYNPVEYMRLNEKEGWMYQVRGKRRLAKMKQADRRVFLKVLETLRENRGLYFNKYEIKEAIGITSVSPVTKSLKLMYELGVVERYNIEGKWYWKFEPTGKRPEVKDPENEPMDPKIEREHKDIKEQAEIVEDDRVLKYVQWINRDGKVEGQFIWTTPERAKYFDEQAQKLKEILARES